MKLRLFLALLMLFTAFGFASAQDAEPVELRVTWYDDGNESEAFRALLDQFEEANPGITVELDVLPYDETYHANIQAAVEAGTPPDLARVNDVARFAGQYLDLTDLVADADYYTENFPEAVLNSLRAGEEDTGIYGFPLQFTITAPFVNRTLFEQAGIPVPSDEAEEVTWEEWITAATEVAAATETPYAVAIDPRGHRFWGFSVVQGATYINEDGTFTIDTPGFRQSAEELIRWHQEGITPPEAWVSQDLNIAKNAFMNGEVVLYYSGNWQLSSFVETIGDTFDWAPVPNPTGEGGSTGIPGGSVLVSFSGTEHPEEVALLMDFLSSEEAVEQFAQETLFIPGHLGLIEQGIEYPEISEALNVFSAEIPKITDQAYALQYSPYTFVLNPAITERLSQVVAGELTLDEAIVAIQEQIDEAVAADASTEG